MVNVSRASRNVSTSLFLFTSSFTNAKSQLLLALYIRTKKIARKYIVEVFNILATLELLLYYAGSSFISNYALKKICRQFYPRLKAPFNFLYHFRHFGRWVAQPRINVKITSVFQEK